MSKPVRAFIAVPVGLSPSLRAMMSRLAECGGPVRMVRDDQLHVTLHFLGETAWERMPEVSRILEAVASQTMASDAELIGLGAFPDRQRPRVVWTRIQADTDLPGTAQQLSERLGLLGFPREERAFQPHITLARVKGRPSPSFLALLRDSEQVPLGSLHIDRIVLYQSELSSTGPVYTVLSEHLLQ